MAEREDLAAIQKAMRDMGGEVKVVSAPAPSPASDTHLCRCPSGVCLMHPNSPEYQEKCSFWNPPKSSPASDDCLKQVAASPTMAHDDNYVAWLRWTGDIQHRHLVVCNSNDEKAFKVYRWPVKTNRHAHEEAAGMGLCDEFFTFNGIDPDAPSVPSPASEQHPNTCLIWLNGRCTCGKVIPISAASEQYEMERRAQKRAEQLHNEVHEVAALVNMQGVEIGWAPEDSVPMLKEALLSFANQEIAAERKRVLEEACKAVCKHCRSMIPVDRNRCHRVGRTPVECAAAAIRKLEER